MICQTKSLAGMCKLDRAGDDYNLLYIFFVECCRAKSTSGIGWLGKQLVVGPPFRSLVKNYGLLYLTHDFTMLK